MLILGIESTCDETSCAVVKDGKYILSNIISSQIEDHRDYGGVVPELASRLHVENIFDTCYRAIKDAGIDIKDIDAIAVSYGPGLTSSISVGISFAEGLSLALNKPIFFINHIKAHLYAAIMNKENIKFPLIGVIISGAHSCMVLMRDHTTFELMGEAIDDAVGESFDKVAAMLHLPYPGGPEVEKRAKNGENVYSYTKCKAPQGKFYFSNSGLKTQVLYTIKKIKRGITESEKNNICRSFQDTIFEDLGDKIKEASNVTKIKTFIFGGGVICNTSMQKYLKDRFPSYSLIFSDKILCTDNAGMIAGFAYYSQDKEGVKRPTPRIPWH